MKRNIKNIIHKIRGEEVILDYDLALLYHCRNKENYINLAVSRNKERFPNSYCFQLTREEYIKLLGLKIKEQDLKDWQFSKNLPYAFTKNGIVMLSFILNTDPAINMSFDIIKEYLEKRKHKVDSNSIEQVLDIIKKKEKTSDNS